MQKIINKTECLTLQMRIPVNHLFKLWANGVQHQLEFIVKSIKSETKNETKKELEQLLKLFK